MYKPLKFWLSVFSQLLHQTSNCNYHWFSWPGSILGSSYAFPQINCFKKTRKLHELTKFYLSTIFICFRIEISNHMFMENWWNNFNLKHCEYWMNSKKSFQLEILNLIEWEVTICSIRAYISSMLVVFELYFIYRYGHVNMKRFEKKNHKIYSSFWANNGQRIPKVVKSLSVQQRGLLVWQPSFR